MVNILNIAKTTGSFYHTLKKVTLYKIKKLPTPWKMKIDGIKQMQTRTKMSLTLSVNCTDLLEYCEMPPPHSLNPELMFQ